ncbi:GAF domain-containing sensor histidine kinase [Longimicrobium sp.]|uniref:GAF domain-containing sensor histidine kinase n=1 Tax=Longimicrobium sp. TaxID=2029185 RepID=UPI003B3B1524
MSTDDLQGTPLPDPHATGGTPAAPPSEAAPSVSRERAALRSAERERDLAEASRDRFSFLAEASRCLADSLDYEATLTTVAGMSLPYLDAWCIVDVLTESGEIRRIAVLHPDPEKQEAARTLHERYPPRASDLIGAQRVVRTSRPEMVFDVPDAALVAAAQDEEHLQLLRKLGIRSYVIVPMVARGNVLGAMTFVTAEHDRRFGDIDVVMAEDLARRAAMAVDNARLHREAENARDVAESALAEAEMALEEAATAEEHLRDARDAAESALRTRDEFVSTMTHEVQTPLNAIIGYLQLLEMDVSGALGDTQRSYVKRAQESSTHLLRLVGDVLDFSKSETARLAVAHEEVDAAETARGALALVRPQASGRLLTLVDETASAAALRYVGDEYRVRQILVNLLSNAIKFTPAGGRVTLECRAQPAGDGDAGSALVFIVTDNGEGVKPEDADRIFEPFVQGAAGLTRRHGGTGLGLPISRRLARLMGGDVTVERRAGPGATFTLRLPAASAAAAPPRPADPPSEDGPRHAANEIRRASAGRGLKSASESLMRRVEETVDEFVRRARTDEALEFTDDMSDVDVADHLGTLVIDVANSLAVLAGNGGEPSSLLADGSRIQRVIGELHGAQRQRLGWTEAQLVREVDLVRDVCLTALGQSLAGDQQAREAAVSALERLLDERTRACLSGFRGSFAAGS